jgi:hypothetical protein
MEKTSEKGRGPPGIVSSMVVVVVVVVIYDSHLQRDTDLWWGGCSGGKDVVSQLTTITQISPANSAVLCFNYFLHHTCHTL